MSEEEQISIEEERVPVPGIDYVVAQDDLETIGVDQLLEGVVSVECFDINRRLTTLDGELPEEQLSATRLLAGLTNYHFQADHPTEPFKPMWIMGDRRSLVPTVLLDEQIEVIATFAPMVGHLGLRARLCDVSWFRHRKRRDMAELAIAAYCDMVEAVRAGDATFSFDNRSPWGIGAKKALVTLRRIEASVQSVAWPESWTRSTLPRRRDVADLPDLHELASEHFTYADLCHCSETWRRTGIENAPQALETYRAISELFENVLEPAGEAANSVVAASTV